MHRGVAEEVATFNVTSCRAPTLWHKATTKPMLPSLERPEALKRPRRITNLPSHSLCTVCFSRLWLYLESSPLFPESVVQTFNLGGVMSARCSMSFLIWACLIILLLLRVAHNVMAILIAERLYRTACLFPPTQLLFNVDHGYPRRVPTRA